MYMSRSAVTTTTFEFVEHILQAMRVGSCGSSRSRFGACGSRACRLECVVKGLGRQALTSILFAAMTSWGVLGEKVRPLRWVGVVVTVVGLVLAKFWRLVFEYLGNHHDRDK